MRRKITAILAAGFLVLAVAIFANSNFGTQGPDVHSDSSTTTSWQTYDNDRFNYRLEVPTSWRSESEPTNADGRVYTSKSGSSSAEVFARNNSDELSFDAVLSGQTQNLQTMSDATISSTTAVLFGQENNARIAKKIIYRTNKIGVVTVRGARSNISSSTRTHILDSFRWTDSPDTSTSTGPATSTENQTEQRSISFTSETAKDLITVATPTSEQTISSPLEISGEARGQWLFEADAPVVLTDWDGRIIAEGTISAESSWMTDEFVPFSGTLEFATPENTGPQSVRGTLIIQRSNPSGQTENDMAVEIPVRFQQ